MPEFRIDDLNSEQLRAATAGEGPVLTIAGAGTGKTKTLASRVAWLVSQGIDPGRIMLLTFTRRASDEMLRRARRALGETGSRMLGTVWGGTFHSVANRLLRTYGEAIGLDPDFTVMDQSDAEDPTASAPPKCATFYSRCANSSDRLDHTLAAFLYDLKSSRSSCSHSMHHGKNAGGSSNRNWRSMSPRSVGVARKSVTLYARRSPMLKTVPTASTSAI